MLMTPQTLQTRLQIEIPISKAMAVEVLEVARDGVRVKAPLAPNINHQSTAFGGSVHSLAVLSCWSLVTVTLDEVGADVEYVVIQDSKIDYQVPVASDFTAQSSWIDAGDRDRFLRMLQKHGRARVELQSFVKSEHGEVCASLTGRFVAQVKNRSVGA